MVKVGLNWLNETYSQSRKEFRPTAATARETDLSKLYFSSTPAKRGVILRKYLSKKALTIWLQPDFK